VPVVLRAQPIRAADGSIVGTVAIFRDDSLQQEARRKIEEMERLAFLDQATQLPNRHYLEMSLRTALDEFHVHNDPFGVLVIDLDRFKAVNDDFGHTTGDRALQEVGKALSGALRSLDIVGRWGGDEFVALVHHVNREILSELAERCCDIVSQTTVPSSDGTRVSISVSIGGTLALPDDTAEALFKRADKLMYQCKTSGRGRFSIDESSPVTETAMRCAATNS
jgi:diguanylate cyclase (GGDEF)-like protein